MFFFVGNVDEQIVGAAIEYFAEQFYMAKVQVGMLSAQDALGSMTWNAFLEQVAVGFFDAAGFKKRA